MDLSKLKKPEGQVKKQRRVGRGIELTPLGRDLATKGAALLDQSESRLTGDVAQGAPRRQLTIGVSPIVDPISPLPASAA